MKKLEVVKLASEEEKSDNDEQIRHFYLQRNEDASGVSGTGVVAVGVVFKKTGQAVMSWLTDFNSLGIYPSVNELESIHSHEGKTVVKWGDPSPEELKKSKKEK